MIFMQTHEKCSQSLDYNTEDILVYGVEAGAEREDPYLGDPAIIICVPLDWISNIDLVNFPHLEGSTINMEVIWVV